MSSQIEKHTALVKSVAASLGFDQCGISKAEFLEEEAPRLENWLQQNYHGKMGYLANHFDKRLDARKLVPDARSVISLAYNYFPENTLPEQNNYKIAKYAYGTDYHFVIKDKLKEFMHRLNDKIGTVHGRAFVDSAPVMERQWAARNGLGWIGKNTMLIHPRKGSFFFLAELIVDLELEEDPPMKDYCGTCTRCIDACPTDALTPYHMDARRCISYLTIELKEDIPEKFSGKVNDWIFGCDICQDVCPWNRFSTPHREPKFNPPAALYDLEKDDWQVLPEEEFRKLFKKSAVKRTKYSGLKRNIQFNRKTD